MIEVGDRFAGLPDDVRRLLVSAPLTETVLLELRVTWPGLPAGHAQMAEVLRVFVVTWDPLELLGSRPNAFATVNVEPFELVVYVPIWSLTEPGSESLSVSARLGAVAASVVAVAAAQQPIVLSGHYPAEVRAGRVPALLSDRDAVAALGPSEVALVSSVWEPIGLGAITDVVSAAFGPIELDRSLVELSAARLTPTCPACSSARFGFPAELGQVRAALCLAHRREADTVTTQRLAAAEASNPEGMSALGMACDRLERPHLPNGLLRKLIGAEEAMFVQAEPDELAARAQALVAAAECFPGRDEDLAVALGADPDMPWLPEWTVNLVLDLGRGGLGAQAALVGDALAAVDVANASMYAADVGVALAESGLADAARVKLAENLAAWPNDFWVRVHAGDALVALDDLDGAEAHFDAARDLADDTDDFEASSVAAERLEELRRRRRRARKGGAAETPTLRPKPGDPCPCASGSKFKHCHGRRRR